MPELPEHFKQVLANPTPENVDSMSAYARSGTFDQRIEMVENGMIDFITELFKLRPQLDVGILNIVWNWLHWFVIVSCLVFYS